MIKYSTIVIYFTISLSVIAQNNWLTFNAPKIPSRSIEIQNPLFIKTKRTQNMNDVFIQHSSNILRKEFLTEPNTIPASFIVCMIQDKKGNIWFGTFGGGVAKYDGTNWEVFNSFNSKLPSDVVYSLEVDKNNIVWIGTVDGLARFDGKRWKIYNKTNSNLPSNMVYSIAVDKNDNKWIGTTKGFVKLTGTNWKNYNTLNSRIPHNHITALAVDSNNLLWIGTFEGLARFDGVNWKVYKDNNSPLPFNDIYSLHIDKSNKVYVGTWGGGLAIVNRNIWNVFNSANSKLPDNYVSSIHVDSNNKLVVGTLEGIGILSGSIWNVWQTKNSPLPNDLVYSLLKDSSDNLWIGTEKGLAVYNEKEIQLISNDYNYDSNLVNQPMYFQNTQNGFLNYTNYLVVNKLAYDLKEKKILTSLRIYKKDSFSISLVNPMSRKTILLKKEIIDSGKHDFEFSLETKIETVYFLKISNGINTFYSKIQIFDF